MKKLISLVLALVLCLTAVSAFAAESPNALKDITEDAEAEGATIVTDEEVLAEAVEFANDQLEDMAATADEETGNKGYYTENSETVFKPSENATEEEKQDPLEEAVKVENLAIIPMPIADVEDNVEEVKITTKDAPAAVKDLQLEENEEIIALFVYEKDGVTYYSVIEFNEVKDEQGNVIGYEFVIPADIAADAVDCNATVNFEKITRVQA